MAAWEQPLEARISAAQTRILETVRQHPTPGTVVADR
jgi:hypothetical protein